MPNIALPKSTRWFELTRNKCDPRTNALALALHDALPGAVPIWQGPSVFHFPALSAKYFADALMMDMVGTPIPPKVETRSQT